jgi:hypothetical protein
MAIKVLLPTSTLGLGWAIQLTLLILKLYMSGTQRSSRDEKEKIEVGAHDGCLFREGKYKNCVWL